VYDWTFPTCVDPFQSVKLLKLGRVDVVTSTMLSVVNLTFSTFDVSVKLRLANVLPVTPIANCPLDGWFEVLIATLSEDPTELTVKLCPATVFARETELWEIAPVPERPVTLVMLFDVPEALLKTSA